MYTSKLNMKTSSVIVWRSRNAISKLV